MNTSKNINRNKNIKKGIDQSDSVLANRIAELEDLEKNLLAELAKAPNGSLQLSKCRGRTTYLHHRQAHNSKAMVRKYLNKNDKELIKALAQKGYNAQLLAKVQMELKNLKEYSTLPSINIDQVYNELCPERQVLVTPYRIPDKEYIKAWQEEPFRSNPSYEEDLQHTTLRGEKVRSKSERSIANTLYRHGIPYKCEKELYLEPIGTFYPDFTILDIKTRKEVYWEHFGLTENENYAMKTARKLDAFARNHLEFGVDYLFTMEAKDQPLDQPVIDQIIKDRFLK